MCFARENVYGFLGIDMGWRGMETFCLEKFFKMSTQFNKISVFGVHPFLIYPGASDVAGWRVRSIHTWSSNIVPPPLLFIYCPFARGSKNYIFAHCIALFCMCQYLQFQSPFQQFLSQHIFFCGYPFDDRYLEIHNDAFDDTIMKMRKHCQHAKSLFDKHHFRWPNTKIFFSSYFAF